MQARSCEVKALALSFGSLRVVRTTARPMANAVYARRTLAARHFERDGCCHSVRFYGGEATRRRPRRSRGISPERPLDSLRSLGVTGSSMSVLGWPSLLDSALRNVIMSRAIRTPLGRGGDQRCGWRAPRFW